MTTLLHYMGMWLDPGDLQPGQCTMRRGSKLNTLGWWMLWFCVTRDDNGEKMIAAVPVNPGGDYVDAEPAGKTWGLKSAGDGTHGWLVSPSINILESSTTHPGEHPTDRSVWHHGDISVVNVPDGERWTGGGLSSRRIRLIAPVGRMGELRVYWDEFERGPDGKKTYLNRCPDVFGMGHSGIHDATVEIGRRPGRSDDDLFGHVYDYEPERWPKVCDHCGAPVPKELLEYDVKESTSIPETADSRLYGARQIHQFDLWNTQSGKIEIADAFWATPGGRGHSYAHDTDPCSYWDNCDGRHLRIMLPDQTIWDVMSRASNCTQKNERTHRCWAIQGQVERGTLSIVSGTCGSGGGSIQTGMYHGVVANGVLTP